MLTGEALGRSRALWQAEVSAGRKPWKLNPLCHARVQLCSWSSCPVQSLSEGSAVPGLCSAGQGQHSCAVQGQEQGQHSFVGQGQPSSAGQGQPKLFVTGTAQLCRAGGTGTAQFCVPASAMQPARGAASLALLPLASCLQGIVAGLPGCRTSLAGF